MGGINNHGKFSKKIISRKKKPRRKPEAQQFPQVLIDEDADFASIKLAPGIEARSYLKDGILFSEDAKGRVIELQILNISLTAARRPKKPEKRDEC